MAKTHEHAHTETKAETPAQSHETPTEAPKAEAQAPAEAEAEAEAQAHETPATPAKAPEAAKQPASEASKPKMHQTVADDGTVTFAFRHGESQVYSLRDFPRNVQEFFALFGLRTKLRNFTTPDSGEKEATSEEMAAKLKKGTELLKQGLLRIAREPGEKQSGGTMFLEAAVIYRRMKAEARGDAFTETEADVAKMIENLTEEQVEQLKGTTLFKLALAEVKEKRAAAKKAALQAQAAREAAQEGTAAI